MKLTQTTQRCVNCGARVRPGEATCHECGEPATDSEVETLTQKLTTTGAAALTPGVARNLGMASVVVSALGDPALAPAASEALASTSHRAVLTELIRLLAHHRWLDVPVKGRWGETGTASLSSLVNKAFLQADPLRASVLLEALGSPDSHIREVAADLLQFQKGEDVDAALSQAMRHDRDPLVRARAARAIGQRCELRYLPLLVDALHDESSAVQSQGAQGLMRLGQGAVPAAAQTLAGGDPTAAFHSAHLLGQVASPEAIHALIDSLKHRRDLVRLYASQALATIGVSALPALLEAVIKNNNSVGVREGVGHVLRTMRMPDREREAVEPVVHALESMNAGIDAPAAAYEALGRLQGVSVDSLRKRLALTL